MGKAKVERAVKAVKAWAFKAGRWVDACGSLDIRQKRSDFGTETPVVRVWIVPVAGYEQPKPSPSPVTPKAAGKRKHGPFPRFTTTLPMTAAERRFVRLFNNGTLQAVKVWRAKDGRVKLSGFPEGCLPGVSPKRYREEFWCDKPQAAAQIAAWRKGRGK